MIRTISLASVAVASFFFAATPDPINPDPNSKRTIEGTDTVFIEDMTWMEVRDAIVDGKTTAIVATGGVEQNGPYLVTGKHNVVLKGATDVLARKLGNALVAPIVPFVPEGDIDPPTVHMKYPGTISVTEETFAALLTDICASLRQHGFTDIVLIGDSGGNQAGMKKVAAVLSKRWQSSGSMVHYIAEYYNFPDVTKYLEENGVKQTPEGYHDDFGMTAMMAAVDPNSVRAKQRIKAGKFRINGVDLAPLDETIKWGHRLIDFRAEAAAKAIRAATKK
ncbi:MAG: hypothetical protein CMJ78_23605 [Planctomycetaceae bacterium]|nr:hypothetical protein [Planctomycetaceae bacterium]